MKTKLKSGMGLFLVLIVILTTGCKEDKIFEPEGAITLNMLNEANGKTILANSNVYINNSNNFYTSVNFLSEVGNVSNLGEKLTPQIHNLSREVAVIPGKAYQIFHSNSLIEFSSGNRAILKDQGYYQVLVKSLIHENEKQVGAVVTYALVFPDGRSLPKTDYDLGKFNFQGDELTLHVGKSVECELAPKNYEDVSSVFDLSVSGETMTVKLKKQPNAVSGPYGDYYVYIRLNNVCVRVHMLVNG